jgi:hypothetical protein
MKNGWQTKTFGEVLQKTETVNPRQSPEDEFSYIDVSSVPAGRRRSAMKQSGTQSQENGS